MTGQGTRTPAAIPRRAGLLLCALLVASSAVELHGSTQHQSDFGLGRVFEESASHPGTPHHFERSEERREPPCATCARQARTHAVQPDPAGRVEAAGDPSLEPPTFTAATLSNLPSSASPRGPPAG